MCNQRSKAPTRAYHTRAPAWSTRVGFESAGKITGVGLGYTFQQLLRGDITGVARQGQLPGTDIVYLTAHRPGYRHLYGSKSEW